MAYGQDSLKVRIRIAFGASIAADPATWVWTDVTAWWHTPDDVQIGWGRSSGAEQPETSTLSLTLKNTDGRFTAYDPRSPYWPAVRKWTPISYDIDLGDGAGWRNRFSGYIRKWPLTWPGASPMMALAKVDAVGLLGRMGRGKPAGRSPLRRTILASNPVAYWPGEDGVMADQAGSAMSGASPLAVAGTVEFTAVADYTIFTGTTTRYGTTALANLAAGGSLQAKLPASAVSATTGGAWTVSVAMQVDTLSGLTSDVVVLEWTTSGGTYTRWQLKITTTLHTQVIGFDPAGASTILIDDSSASPAFVHHTVSASLSGGTVTVRLYRDPSIPTTTFAGTLGGITSVAVNPTGATSISDMPAGHIAVWATGTPPLARAAYFDSYGGLVREARRSWAGEAATDRLTRLVTEDGLTLAMPAVPADAVTRMGWQAPGTPLELYQQCETTDQGLIYESGFGLGYLPRGARYNAPVALTIDAALQQLGMPFEPVDDDQMLRNMWTVQRIDGSSAVAADAESIEFQGEIEGSATISLASDGPLPDDAGWRLRLSTVQEPRYPALSINLAAHPELAAAWTSCKPGSRVQVVNPPAQNVPGTVDQLVVGASETYRGRRSWKATLNVVPATPWDVATADGEQRAPADGSTLAAALTSSGTSLVIASTVENGPWTQDPADFPLDLRVGGEKVTASAIGPMVDDPLDAAVSNGWGTTPTGETWQVAVGTAANLSVSGGFARHSLPANDTPQVSLLPVTLAAFDVVFPARITTLATGDVLVAELAARWVNASNHYRFEAHFLTGGAIDLRVVRIVGGGRTVIGAASAVATYAANVSVWVRCKGDGSTLSMKAWGQSAPEPGTWHVTVTDGTYSSGQVGVYSLAAGGNTNAKPVQILYGSFTVLNPQRATVSARAVNGVARAWPAGTEVDVWQPAIAAL